MSVPSITEPICPVSFEVTSILLGGGPDSRTSFWKTYRQELALNQKTEFRNEHVRICGRMLAAAFSRLNEPYFYRNGRLVVEKPIDSLVTARRLERDAAREGR